MKLNVTNTGNLSTLPDVDAEDALVDDMTKVPSTSLKWPTEPAPTAL